MHKLCSLCKLLHYYVIYAFYVSDCIIMQIMNIPCILCIVVKIKLIINSDVNYASKPGLEPGFRRIIYIINVIMPKIQGMFIICIILSLTELLTGIASGLHASSSSTSPIYPRS